MPSKGGTGASVRSNHDEALRHSVTWVIAQVAGISMAVITS